MEEGHPYYLVTELWGVTLRGRHASENVYKPPQEKGGGEEGQQHTACVS